MPRELAVDALLGVAEMAGISRVVRGSPIRGSTLCWRKSSAEATGGIKGDAPTGRLPSGGVDGGGVDGGDLVRGATLILAAVGPVIGYLTYRRVGRASRRARIEEILGVVTEIKAAIDWGDERGVLRDTLQGRLGTLVIGEKLPACDALAHAVLRSDVESSDLAARACAELEPELRRLA
jgi:hypothetical protein